MPVCDRSTIHAVTADQRAGQRDSSFPRVPCHHPVARDQSGIRQGQSTQAVIPVRIDTRLQEDQVRHEVVQGAWQRSLEDVQICGVAGQVRQGDVQGRARFACREVLFGIDGKSEDVAAPRRQRRRSIALMDVEVEDQDAGYIAFLDQSVGGNGQVVEDAVPRPVSANA